MSAATTLATFFVENIHSTGSVTLYGSWDGFTKGYSMHKDRQAGHGRWHGCFTFQDIVCDGDPSRCTARRDGALMEGGMYWYFFKKDGHLEFHNPASPFTTSCPLLPGQTVNVWEIPVQTDAPEGQQLLGDKPFDYLALDARDRFPDRQRPARSPQRTEQKIEPARSQQLAAKTRREWLTASIGRLQTAVVEQIILGPSDKSGSSSPFSWPGRRRVVKSAHGTSDSESRPLPTLEDLRKSQAFFNTGKASPKMPRSHFGSSKAARSSLAPPHPGLTREFSNPFLSTRSTSTGPSTASASSKLSTAELGAPRPPTWTEGLSDGHLAARRRWRTLILNRSRPSSAPGRHETSQQSQPQPSHTSASERATVARRRSDRRVAMGVARHPNRISEVPELEALATQAPTEVEGQTPSRQASVRPSRSCSPTSASSSRSASIIRKYSNRGRLPRVSSTKSSRLTQIDVSPEELLAPEHGRKAVYEFEHALWTPAATSPSDTTPALSPPELQTAVSPLESPVDFARPVPARNSSFVTATTSGFDSTETIRPRDTFSSEPHTYTDSGHPAARVLQQHAEPASTATPNFSRPRGQGHRRLHTDEGIGDCSPGIEQGAELKGGAGETRIADLEDIEYLGSVIF